MYQDIFGTKNHARKMIHNDFELFQVFFFQSCRVVELRLKKVVISESLITVFNSSVIS